jgi:hypothetical protein
MEATAKLCASLIVRACPIPPDAPTTTTFISLLNKLSCISNLLRDSKPLKERGRRLEER